MGYKLNYKLVGYALIALVFIFGIYTLFLNYRPSAGKLDSFAKCIADKGLTMYGAYWCPHCQNVKALFGSSFEYMKYVECTEHADVCTAQGVKGYPTFIFSDGRRLVGEKNLNELSEATGCPLVYDPNK